MNQDALNSQQHSDQDPNNSDRPPSDTQQGDTQQGDTQQGDTQQGDTQQGDTQQGELSIRVGSPFAVDPFEPDTTRQIEIFYDVGPLKYTAMGAVFASAMVVGFAAAAAYFFPIGGTMIAALGCVLSIFGMYSSYRLTAAGLLAIHLCLFVLSYGRTLD